MELDTNIVNHLALKAALISDSSLYHGRMGIILALYCHGVAHNNKMLCDYTRDILQDTSKDYYDGDISIESGLSGLGLGFTLLYKADMYQDDLNDLLLDIDKKIMSVDPRRIDDYSFRKGALGILYYIKVRLAINQSCLSIHKNYIEELIANIRTNGYDLFEPKSFIDSLKQPTWKKEDYLEKETGIDDGCAYYIIKESYDKVFSR